MNNNTVEDIANIRAAGRVSRTILAELGSEIRPGITTYDIEKHSVALMKKHKVISAFLGYHGFPANICVSVNDEVVHGIPSKKRPLSEGDIVSLDVGVVYRECFGDCAETFPVGNVERAKALLIEISERAFRASLDYCFAGRKTGDIGAAIQNCAESEGFSVVRDFAGHGIGRSLHLPPEVPNFGTPGRGKLLKEGMVLAIEPMINQGGSEVKTLNDGWTVKTCDGRCSSHYENCVLITGGVPEVLST